MSERPGAGWGPYRFAPLVGLIVIVVIVAFTLPSSLNQPQANPTETAEFAPVPPSDETPPPIGNLLITATGG